MEFLGRVFCVRGAEPMCGRGRYAKSRVVDDDEGSVNRNSHSHAHHIALHRKSSDTWRRLQEPHITQNHQVELPIGQSQSCDVHPGLRHLERSCEHLEAQLEDVRKMLERVVVTSQQKDFLHREFHQIIQEWKLVAQALDRFFFVLYLGIIVVSLLTMFPRPPFIKS